MFKLLKYAYLSNKRHIRNMALLVMGLEIIHVIALYYLNQILGTLYDGIQNYQEHIIWTSIYQFTGIAMFLVLITGYAGYFSNKLAFRIREGLTAFFFSHEFAYSKVPLLNQRVQEDFRRFGESFIDLIVPIFRSLLKIPIFVFVIIGLTKVSTGLLLLAAILAGTWFSRYVSLMLVPLQSEQEANEAKFRADLSVLSFKVIRDQFMKINAMFKRLSFTQSGLGQMFVLLPFMIFMPLYLSHGINFGQFYQAVNALGKIIDSLTILIDSRQVIISVETSVVRLSFLKDELASFSKQGESDASNG